MEFIGKLLGQATLIDWAVSALVPILSGIFWRYWAKTGIDVSQEKIKQINGIALARAGQFVAKLLSGELVWADLAKFAKDAAAIALQINPDIKKIKHMTEEVLADRIEAQVGQLASNDPTMALPTPPAGATVGNVAVAGTAAKAAIKEVADAPTIIGGNNIPGANYDGTPRR